MSLGHSINKLGSSSTLGDDACKYRLNDISLVHLINRLGSSSTLGNAACKYRLNDISLGHSINRIGSSFALGNAACKYRRNDMSLGDSNRQAMFFIYPWSDACMYRSPVFFWASANSPSSLLRHENAVCKYRLNDVFLGFDRHHRFFFYALRTPLAGTDWTMSFWTSTNSPRSLLRHENAVCQYRLNDKSVWDSTNRRGSFSMPWGRRLQVLIEQ